MAFGTAGAASAIAAAQAAIPRLNLAIPRKSGAGNGVGLAATAAGARQPSMGHALAAWLFGGSTPMDDERARIAGAQQAQQMLEMRQALMSKLTGGGGVPDGVPMRQPTPEAAPAPLEPRIAPLKMAVDDVTAGLGEDTFGATPDPLTQAGPRVAVEAPQLPSGIPMKSGAPAQQRGKIPTLRDSADWLLPMAAMGVPGAKEAIDYLKETSPKGTNVNGRFLDERDPSAMGKFYGDAPEKGSEPVYDRNGNEVGWRMADGTLQVMQQASEATELGKTRGGILKVPMRDGSERTMLGRDFIDAQQGGGPSDAGGGAGGGLGQSQTPAEKVRSEGLAKTEVEVAALTPKAKSALETMDRKSDFVLGALDELLGEQYDPKSGKTVRVGDPMVRGGLGGTAGLNELTKAIPGTASRNLDAKLDTLRATLGFAELQTMRDNSPTGGAVGNLTERELTLLSSLIGSLDQGQDPEQLVGNLRGQRDELRKVREERRRAFQRQYGNSRQGARPAPPEVGAVVRGYRFNGGDPANPQSWAKAQ